MSGNCLILAAAGRRLLYVAKDRLAGAEGNLYLGVGNVAPFSGGSSSPVTRIHINGTDMRIRCRPAWCHRPYGCIVQSLP